jgi:large subunit ribosomal protein L3
MKYILGKKLEMTQKFKEDGKVVPVTIVKAGPCFITQVKTQESDGYKALQVGFAEKKTINKPLAGHLKNNIKARYLREVRLDDKSGKIFTKGQEIDVNIFQKGEKVMVSGVSKGKGFQGVVKRHHFHGHNTTHGTKDQVRHSGSIGATGPQHVLKGMRMAGRMGGSQVTLTNLEIFDIDPAKNLLYIKGAIPGAKNGLVEIAAPGDMDLKEKVVKESKEEVKPEIEAVNKKVEGPVQD